LKKYLVVLLLVIGGLAFACARKRQSIVDPVTTADVTRPAAKWLEMEPVRLLRDYVRVDTRLERGEQEGAEFLESFFDCAGIDTQIVCPAPRRCNLLARIPGKRREGALLLLNHIDVAPVAPSRWKDFPPFEGGIKGGYLYGRGVYDMKSLAIVQALAMRNLKAHGIVPQSDVLFLAEADEEIGHRWGARWLLEHRPEWFEGVGAVVNEGAVIEVVLRDPRFWGIETVQAGYASAEFEAAARAPLDALAAKWKKLDAPTVEPHPQVTLGFDMLANHMTSPLTDPLRHLNRVRKNPAELAILPDRYASFLQPRIYWSGVLPNAAGVPGFIALTVISTPPGVSPTPFFEAVLKDARRRGVKTTTSFDSGVTSASPYPTQFTELLRRVTQAHFPGVPFGPIPVFSAYTTSVWFRQRGFPTYGYSSIPMNITDAVRRHGNNERIYLRDYLKGVALFQDVLEEFALNPRKTDLSPLGLEK
jgi:acetylornithine deacetylase/succinyl-diaminopimelate desuccinylase-like protein